jgi:hypothetical protein
MGVITPDMSGTILTKCFYHQLREFGGMILPVPKFNGLATSRATLVLFHCKCNILLVTVFCILGTTVSDKNRDILRKHS